MIDRLERDGALCCRCGAPSLMLVRGEPLCGLHGGWTTRTTLPDILRSVVPRVGSRWIWEPLKAHAREPVRVTQVTWNGAAVWVESEGAGGKRSWNELDRWVEATVLVDAEG